MIHSLHSFHPCHRVVIHRAFFSWMDMKIGVRVAAYDHYVSRGAQIAFKIGDRSAGPLIKMAKLSITSSPERRGLSDCRVMRRPPSVFVAVESGARARLERARPVTFQSNVSTTCDPFGGVKSA